MDFRELEAFVWIVKLGSFKHAAEHLHITQPSISERIARLEDFLGEKVLLREHRPVLPTLKGRELFRQAEMMLQERQNAIDNFRAQTDYQGVFRLGVVETIAQSWLPDLLTLLSDRFPAMTIEMEVDGSPGLEKKITTNELDLAFLMGPINHDHIVNRLLCRYPMRFIAHPDFKGMYREDVNDYLEHCVLLSFSRESIPYKDLRFMLAERGIENPRIHCSSSIWTIARLAMAHSGIGVMPPIIVRNELADGRLVKLNLPLHLPNLIFTASWPASYDSWLAEKIARIAHDVAHQAPWGDELAAT
ncbi:LysR family transcriptional regulator [Salinispirillum marinum]|uniref:LysR family transcriptional regulator n=2 Tax=Saccharospirillaceae TaxID=255527 RepID=A0ABV8BJB5_9GAMM